MRAAIFDELASFRHHSKVIMDLLSNVDWLIVDILVICLPDYFLIWISLDKMIWRVSNLLIVERK